MQPLFSDWPKIAKSLRNRRVALFLDFDGTLAPIVSSPSRAVLPARTRRVLEKLNAKDWCTVAVISGRSLDDLAGKVGIAGLIYGGNHGVRLKGPDVDFHAPVSGEVRAILAALLMRLGALSASVAGVLVEDKMESISVHFRKVKEEAVPDVMRTVEAAAQPFLETGAIRLSAGKKVLEARPNSWNKGKAVAWLLDHVNARCPGPGEVFPVYVGDDVTDEDAFAAIAGNGLSVRVGNDGPTLAGYSLRNTNEVFKFLTFLLSTKKLEFSSIPGLQV